MVGVFRDVGTISFLGIFFTMKTASNRFHAAVRLSQ
jgi:hypothetical protein